MRVLVIGTGSIGQRHIANLISLGAKVLAYSQRSESIKNLRSKFPSVRVFTSLDEALSADIQAAIICCSTDQHIPIASKVAEKQKPLFIEKPLSASLDGIDNFNFQITSQGLLVECGFMLRTHPNIVFLKDALRRGIFGKVRFIRAFVGHDLRQWRPERDYRSTYSAFRQGGGGVVLDLIHELDLVYFLFGGIHGVYAELLESESLEIETEAIAEIILNLKSGLVAQVHLDYLRPVYGRELEIVTDDGVVAWSYLEGEISFHKPNEGVRIVDKVPEGFSRNEMFKNYMNTFLELVKNPSAELVSPISDAIEVLKVALACHESSRCEAKVYL
jgi:predicted dehydrogenase